MSIEKSLEMENWKLRITPKRSLGQNFLTNQGILDKIILSARLEKKDTVLEIGPGTGNLTRKLAASGARIIAVEKDSRLIGPLREEFPAGENVEIVEGDV